MVRAGVVVGMPLRIVTTARVRQVERWTLMPRRVLWPAVLGTVTSIGPLEGERTPQCAAAAR